MNDLRQSLLYADPRLSKFDPLSRIIFYDDFDHGPQGWIELIGNYEHSLDSMLPDYRDLRPPMLSSGTMWDTGTHGSFEGTYALKFATRPRAGHLCAGIKRVTWRKRGPIRLETYFTFKPEASELRLSLSDVRAVGVLFDLQDEKIRWMPHLRYLNAEAGVLQQKWQFKRKHEPFHEIGTTGETRSFFHLADQDWEDIPGGQQQLCYNEIATKYNWHYLRVDLDLKSRRLLHFQCNDQVHDISQVGTISLPAVPNAWELLNVLFWAETDVDKRAFLYVDSVLLSGDF